MSTSSQNQTQILNEGENFLNAMHLPGNAVLCMVLRAAFELDLFEIMAKAGPAAQLSASEIAASLQTQNPKAPVMLDRILRFLASYSILNCTLVSDEENGRAKRLYSLAPISKNYIRNEDGVSHAPVLSLVFDKVFMATWYHLKDAILEGGIPFHRAYGMDAFEYLGKDDRFNEVYNKAMYNASKMTMEKILEAYNGFEGVNEVLDVGGGTGVSLACILSKYPMIRGINFDLPHVIKAAPAIPGVEHVEGDMFESVPKGEVIFMKAMFHGWGDDHCIKLLKNCWKALPEYGKVISVEIMVPENPESDRWSNIGFFFDIMMLSYHDGGKERTKEEFESLAKQAGYAAVKPVCRAFNYVVLEFYKGLA